MRALAAEIGIGVSTHEVPTFEAVRDTLLAGARQETKPFLVAWILREEGTRKIHLFDPWNNQLRVRTVQAGASPTANAETLALILRAELLAYLNEPPPADAGAATTPRHRRPRAPLPAGHWRCPTSPGLSCATSTCSRASGWALPITGLACAWAPTTGFCPVKTCGAEDVALTVRRHPFDLDVGYASSEHHRLRLVAEAFLSGDLVSRHTSFAAEPLLAQPDDRRFVMGAGLRGRVEQRVFRNLIVHLTLGIEAPLNPHDFQITRGTTTTTVARLSPVRVSGEAGVNILAF